MGSKLTFLGILLAMVLISSDAARELGKETTNAVTPSPVNEAKYQWGHEEAPAYKTAPPVNGGFNGCYECSSAGEKADAQP